MIFLKKFFFDVPRSSAKAENARGFGGIKCCRGRLVIGGRLCHTPKFDSHINIKGFRSQ